MSYSESDSDTGLGEGSGVAGGTTGTATSGFTSGDASDRDADLATGTSTRSDADYDRDTSRTSSFDDAPPVGQDVSGPETDNAMTRSEEELSVGTRQREAGRARLRKYVVTEEVQQTVPVRHEEVRVEREPITDENRDAALSGPEISEAEHEVTLHEERPVAQTETVPVERVRMSTEERTDEETVRGRVRKERIEAEGTEDAQGTDQRRRDE
jgi:uncharacterized protein (TIGR02271 family)